MLFSLLILLIPVMCLIMLLVYRQGIKDGQKIEKKEELPPIAQHFSLKGEKKSDELEKINRIIKNIDEYGVEL